MFNYYLDLRSLICAGPVIDYKRQINEYELFKNKISINDHLYYLAFAFMPGHKAASGGKLCCR